MDELIPSENGNIAIFDDFFAKKHKKGGVFAEK